MDFEAQGRIQMGNDDMSMALDNTVSLRYSIHGTGSVASDENPIQLLELRLGHSTHLVSRYPYEIVEQSPSTPIADALFHLPLRKLQQPPFLSYFFVVRFLSSFNFSIADCNQIFQTITSHALQLASGELDLNFHMIVSLDYIQMHIQEHPGAATSASASAIERLKKEKFDGLVEAGADCSVCCDQLLDDDSENEVARMPCGHVYHKSCILNWLEIKNSCPLCRTKLDE